MIESLISSKTRIKLLVKFFLHQGTTGYLRGLESEFGENSNAIRLELNRMMKAGLITSRSAGNKRIFQANDGHPLYQNLRDLVAKHVGLDRIVDAVVAKIGDLEKVYLVGPFCRRIDAGTIDLIFVGDLDRNSLAHYTKRAEALVDREINYRVLTEVDHLPGAMNLGDETPVLLWERQRAEP